MLPSWLESRHEAWLRSAIETLEAVAGATAADLQARGEELAIDARSLGISATTAAGVWHVLRRFGTTHVSARVAPRVLRASLFEAAARLGIESALRQSAKDMRVSPDELRAWLYADLPEARTFRLIKSPNPTDVRDAYNMALAQGLLGRCTGVVVRVEENLRMVVRSAKLRGLLVSITADGSVIRASGPMALFRHTTKYARALAMFLPSLVSHPRWSLVGELALGDEVAALHLGPTAPLPRMEKLPERTDSHLERSLLRSLQASRSGWRVRREGVVLRCGRELFFPDFVLERGDMRVVVEVVGFWTPEYLERKMGQLATVVDVPIVVCVDETLACDPSRLTGVEVVRFRRRMDGAALIEAAERALVRHAHRK